MCRLSKGYVLSFTYFPCGDALCPTVNKGLALCRGTVEAEQKGTVENGGLVQNQR